jgi:hypothetical protein
MRIMKHTLVQRAAVAVLAAMAAIASVDAVQASGNVVMSLDGMIVNNTGAGQPSWGGYGTFSYGSITVGTSSTLGRYDSFTIAEPGTGGSGLGVNFAIGNINSPVDAFLGAVTPVTANMFPLLDRGTFGVNFDPNQYVAELIYKPLPGNTATQLNMTLDTTDGFTAEGGRSGEQLQWGFFDLVNTYNNTQTNGNLDADGFARSFSNTGVLSQAAMQFSGQSYMYQTGNPTGDGQADLNDFEGNVLPVPNGAVQIQLQTVYGTGEALVDNWEIKALRIVKINPDTREVARLDGRSGFSQRFGSPFQRNPGIITIDGVDYDPVVTDQVSRFNAAGFTNIVVNTDDDAAVGGLGLWQPATTQTFNGSVANMEIRARLTAPLAGQADHIVLVAKDKDGNGTANVGDFGGEEYHFNIPLSSFNEAGMTTFSLPFSAASILQAQEFATAGDGSFANFNLYYLGLQTDAGAGLVDLEIEFVRIALPGRAGDFNGDNVVDGQDFLVWQRGLGTQYNANDLAAWRTNYGVPASAAAQAIPEPASAALALGFIAAATTMARGKAQGVARALTFSSPIC